MSIDISESGFAQRVGTEVRRSRLTSDAGEIALPSISEETPSMTGARRWAANHDTFWGATETYNALPPALYRCEHSNNLGPILIKQKSETDDLIEMPGDASASVVREFIRFWQLRDEFKKRGFLHKRGYLLWGPPGSGKTSTLQLLLQRLIQEHEGVAVFLDNPHLAARCLHMMRQIESDRPLIAVMEDLDALIERHGENEYLALLDGEAQVDNVVFVATTNYPERLDKRFVDRPSRFDTIKFIGMPSAAARRAYLLAKEPSLAVSEINLWVELSEGFSVAHLKEMIIANRCFEQPIEEVARRLEELHHRQPTSSDNPDRPAFGIVGVGR